MIRRLLIALFAAGFVFCSASVARAQPLGVFRWQMQPYCNVVTFTVVPQGPSFLLTGADNMCGVGTAGAATGSAVVNPNGLVSMGFSVVTPAGAAAQISAVVNLSSNVSGTWQDADGRTGPFVFNPPAPPPGVPARPAPSRSVAITSAQLAASIFAGTGTATTIARSDHTHDSRYYTQAQTAAIVGAAAAEVAIGTGVNGQTLTPLLTPPALVDHVLTSKAGRLLVTRQVSVNAFACSSGTLFYVYLLLDGVVLQSSFVIANGPFTAHLVGVTPNSVGPGGHTVSVSARCAFGNITSWGFLPYARSAAVVMP